MLTELLASFIQKWKIANPRLYTVIVVILITVNAAIIALQHSGIMAVDMTEIAGWLTFLIALFVHHSPETSPKNQEPEGEEPDEQDPSNDPIADTVKTESESLIAPLTPKKRGRPRKIQGF